MHVSLLALLALSLGCWRDRAVPEREVQRPLGSKPSPPVPGAAPAEPTQLEALERLAATVPSDELALDAIGKLRAIHLERLTRILDARIARALTAGRTDDARTLETARERYAVMTHGAAFPAFLREPPPLFTAPSGGAAKIRVLAFGDFGTGKHPQPEVARQITVRHARRRFDFAITLGDNFYPRGMRAPNDPRWATDFDALYDPLGIPFFATLGNHDWLHPDSAAAEILRDSPSHNWRMPASHYTFTAGPVQFFAIDTNFLATRQLEWLSAALAASQARWKIVYGHHPIRSHGVHGDFVPAVERLLPVLRNRAQLYVAGHDHDLQHLREEEGVHFVIAGGGGQVTRPITPGPRSLFAASRNGFAEIEADAQSLTVNLVSDAGEVLHTFRLPADAAATVPPASR